MNDIKFKIALPFIAIVLTVFLGVVTSSVCYGVFNEKQEADISYKNIDTYRRRNVFVSVKDSETGTLNVSVVVSFDPKDKTVKMISIPSNTHVKIASSDQMFKNVMNIGGTELLRSTLETVVPLPVDYHLIINSDDLYCENGDYYGLVRNTFSGYLWRNDDLNAYLGEVLNLSSTDLTLFKTEEYARFLNVFRESSFEAYTIEGMNVLIDERIFYQINHNLTNDMINTSILN